MAVESPRQLAERQIEEEERRRREERIEALAVEEEERRRVDRAEIEREERRRAAEAHFDRLAVDRGMLEDRAQTQLDSLMETLATIDRVDTEQIRLARAAGRTTPRTTFRGTWQTWAAGALLGHPDTWGGATLRERDMLSAAKPATEEEEGEVTEGNVSPADPDPKLSCAGTKGDGSRCQNAPTTGSAFCAAHDPERAEARKEAARIAGRARHGLEA